MLIIGQKSKALSNSDRDAVLLGIIAHRSLALAAVRILLAGGNRRAFHLRRLRRRRVDAQGGTLFTKGSDTVRDSIDRHIRACTKRQPVSL